VSDEVWSILLEVPATVDQDVVEPSTLGKAASRCRASRTRCCFLRWTSVSSTVKVCPAASIRAIRVSGVASSISTFVPLPRCHGASRTEYIWSTPEWIGSSRSSVNRVCRDLTTRGCGLEGVEYEVEPEVELVAEVVAGPEDVQDFSEPEVVSASGPLWARGSVEGWMHSHPELRPWPPVDSPRVARPHSSREGEAGDSSYRDALG
jgi:hypothetical protein